MEKLPNTTKVLLYYYNKGYRVENGILYDENKEKIKVFSNSGYFCCNRYTEEKTLGKLFIHRLVAYQKYKDKIFEKDIVVRHLDGNSFNNLEENISIGTQKENMGDRNKEDLLKHAIKASYTNRRFTDEEVSKIIMDRKSGLTYKNLCKKYNTSKSTLSYLFNNALYAKE
jgi:hypothetical protein